MNEARLLAKAISLYGSKTKLAAAVGVGKQHVYNWEVAGRIPNWRLDAVKRAIEAMRK